MSSAATPITPRTAALIDVVSLLLLAACGWAVLDANGVARAVPVLAAAAFIPGWAVLTRVRPIDLLTAVALSVALSIALEIAGSLMLGWVRWWHPEVLGVFLAAASAALMLAQLVSVARRSGAERTESVSCR